MSQPTIPAFDPDGPDAEILEAFEQVRAHRAWAYSHDYLAKADPEAFDRFAEQTEPFDDQMIVVEGMVRKNWATTPSGVAAQLALSLTDGGCDRLLDRGMAECGMRALYQQREALGLDEHQTTIVTAAYELLHIEWEAALLVYEQAKQNFGLFLQIKGEVDRLRFSSETSRFAPLNSLIDAAEDAFCDSPASRRLIRTLAPDWTCYRRKAEIAIAEDLASEAAPWLVRDVNFLTGVIVEEAGQAEAAE